MTVPAEIQQCLRVICTMIDLSAEEAAWFAGSCSTRFLKRKASLLHPGERVDEVYFVVSGLLRVYVTDKEGREHTIHFATENQFITDYSSFLRNELAVYTIEAIETTEIVVLSRDLIEKGYRELTQGEKLGRLIAEYYFVYQDHHIRKMHTHSPKERYDEIRQIFPGILQRAPQHMIASYLGITPVHLSRLKRDS